LLALAVVPLVRAALRTDRLRAPRVLTGQLGVGSARG
jgi:hypothetical protein